MITILSPQASLVDYRTIEPFQGKLKDLTRENYDKLLNSIRSEGFFVPMFLWQHEDHNYCLDGHGRLRVLTNEQIEFENTGYQVPAYFIPGDDFKQAKKRLLLITSQFQKITQEGIDAFIAEAELPEETLADVNFDALAFPEVNTSGQGESQEGGESQEAKTIVCPSCGTEFAPR
jgi:ParB-like chromosome segregation protein Spo0J